MNTVAASDKIASPTPAGQVAIVTGASSGIGLGITLALLEHGFRVVANSRNISKSKDLTPSTDLVLVDGDIGEKEIAVKVADGASKLLVQIFRPDAGHMRLVYGVQSMAIGAPVMVETIFEIR